MHDIVVFCLTVLERGLHITKFAWSHYQLPMIEVEIQDVLYMF